MPYDMDIADRDWRRDRDIILGGDFPSFGAAVRAIDTAFREARDAGRDGLELAALLTALSETRWRVTLSTRASIVRSRAFPRGLPEAAGADDLVVALSKKGNQPRSIRLAELLTVLTEVEATNGR